MTRNHVLTRALTAALATTALLTPMAAAKPIDPLGTGTTQAGGAGSASVTPLPSSPTWPKNPKPITNSQPQIDDGDGTPWATIGLALTSAGLIAGSATAVGRARRRQRQPGVAS
jgi:hypothetical protein